MIPFAAGLLHIRRRRFSLSNLIGAVIWVTMLAFFGVAIQSLLVLLHDDLLRYQMHIAVGVFLLGILVGLASIPWQLMRLGARRRAAALAAARAARVANATLKATARNFPAPHFPAARRTAVRSSSQAANNETAANSSLEQPYAP